MPKDYYYIRNGIIHKKFTRDVAIQLSPTETAMVIDALAKEPYNKQEVLADKWNFFENCVGKEVRESHDVVEDNIARLSEQYARKESKGGLKA